MLFIYVYSFNPAEKRRGLLAFKTMYKKKSGTGSSDGLMPDASPSTPLAPSDISNSAGKVTDNSEDEQRNYEKSQNGVKKRKSDRLPFKATALDESAPSSAEQPISEGSSPSSKGKGNEENQNAQENSKKNVERHLY